MAILAKGRSILENGHEVYLGAAADLARNVEVKRRYLGI